VSKHTIYAWKAKYGGMDVSEAQEVKPRKIVATAQLRSVIRSQWCHAGLLATGRLRLAEGSANRTHQRLSSSRRLVLKTSPDTSPDCLPISAYKRRAPRGLLCGNGTRLRPDAGRAANYRSAVSLGLPSDISV